MYINKIFNSCTAILMLALVSSTSCTKTETIDYEKEPANKILEYKVTNSQQELLGSIDHKNNVIIVYIPYYIGVDYLIAKITLEDKDAAIFDEAGNEINLKEDGVAPVQLGTDTIKYTVKSVEGISRTYSLIQKILPHPDALIATYSGNTSSMLTRPVNAKLTLLGNFESTSLNGKFSLTNKSTGEVNSNWLTVNSVDAGNQYTMVANISPDAVAGEYSVKMEHQGRTTTLPDLKLVYQKAYISTLFSSASYAPGDTITFANYVNYASDTYATIFLPVKKVYLKIAKGKTTPPAGFTDNYYDTPIEMQIVSQSRTELKAIFPQVPAGAYTSNVSEAKTIDGYLQFTDSGFGFYADYEESTGWGTGHLFCAASRIRFTVK